MRVLLVTEAMEAGGVATACIQIAEMLLRHGDEVAFFSLAGPTTQPFEAKYRFYKGARDIYAWFRQQNKWLRELLYLLMSCGGKRFWEHRLAKKMQACLRDFRPDMILYHGYRDFLDTDCLFQTFRTFNIPCLLTFHDGSIICPASTLLIPDGADQFRECTGICAREKNKGASCREFRCISKLMARQHGIAAFRKRLKRIPGKADLYLTPSEALRNLIIQNGVIPERDIFSCMHPQAGVPAKLQDDEGIPVEKTYFLAFGRIASFKGFGALVQAFSHLRDIPLVLIGEGDQVEQINHFIREKQLTNITLKSWMPQEELQGYLKDAYAVIVPSLMFEALCLTGLEAFMHGKPVIASARGGIGDYVIDNETGLHVIPGDVVSHVEKIRYLWENPELAGKLGNNAAEFMRQKFDDSVKYAELMHLMELAASRFSARHPS